MRDNLFVTTIHLHTRGKVSQQCMREEKENGSGNASAPEDHSQLGPQEVGKLADQALNELCGLPQELLTYRESNSVTIKSLCALALLT